MNTEKIKIGLPFGLMHLEHGALWKKFFERLGCNVIFSCPTNKSILEAGVRSCSNDTCLAVKVFHGHVLWLKGKVDFIFIPRYISMDENSFCCPKLCGLPDMTYLNLKKSFNLLEVCLDFRAGVFKTLESLKSVSEALNLNFEFVKDCYEDTIGYNIENNFNSVRPKTYIYKRSVAVIGHPYMIYDDFISMNLINKLNKKGFCVLTPLDLNRRTKYENASPFCEKCFWESGYDTLGSAYTYFNYANLSGIIYLTPFACGIDSIVTELIERNYKHSKINYMKITVDEHTAQAGFDTRLEAFLDMILCAV